MFQDYPYSQLSADPPIQLKIQKIIECFGVDKTEVVNLTSAIQPALFLRTFVNLKDAIQKV